LERDNLPGISDTQYQQFMTKVKHAYEISRERFIVHYKKTYADTNPLPPYWILVEIFDFGMMYKLFNGAPKDVKRTIAEKFEVPVTVLDSWLKALNVIRNICAHHGRLWNKVLGFKPVIPRKDERWHSPIEVNNEKIFSILTILNYMLGIIAPDSSWQKRLLNLFNEYPTVPKKQMGFVEGWEEQPFWKTAD
jgi:abortive infection bacteriophage resistance protein